MIRESTEQISGVFGGEWRAQESKLACDVADVMVVRPARDKHRADTVQRRCEGIAEAIDFVMEENFGMRLVNTR